MKILRTAFISLALFNPFGAATAEYPAGPVVKGRLFFSSDAGLTAYDRQTLVPRWRALEGLVTGHPLLSGVLLFVTTGSSVYALSPGDGKMIWQRRLNSDLFSPVAEEGRLFVAARDGSLHAFNKSNGNALWTRKLGGGWVYPPAIVRGIIVTGGRGARLWGLSVETGKTLWEKPLSQELVYRPVAADRNSVIVTSFDGRIFAVDPFDGSLIWTRQFPAPSHSALVVGNELFLTSFDNRLRALQVADGELLWFEELPGRTVPELKVQDDLLLALTDDGDYLFLHKNDGRILGRGKLNSTFLGAAFAGIKQAAIFSKRRNTVDASPVFISTPGFSYRPPTEKKP